MIEHEHVESALHAHRHRNERIQERGGNRALKKRTIMLQIIDEIGDITTPKGKDESRAQLSAAYIRWSQAQRDHAEEDPGF